MSVALEVARNTTERAVHVVPRITGISHFERGDNEYVRTANPYLRTRRGGLANVDFAMVRVEEGPVGLLHRLEKVVYLLAVANQPAMQDKGRRGDAPINLVPAAVLAWMPCNGESAYGSARREEVRELPGAACEPAVQMSQRHDRVDTPIPTILQLTSSFPPMTYHRPQRGSEKRNNAPLPRLLVQPHTEHAEALERPEDEPRQACVPRDIPRREALQEVAEQDRTLGGVVGGQRLVRLEAGAQAGLRRGLEVGRRRRAAVDGCALHRRRGGQCHAGRWRRMRLLKARSRSGVTVCKALLRRFRVDTSSITVPADCLIKNEIRSETRVHPEFDKMTYANPD